MISGARCVDEFRPHSAGVQRVHLSWTEEAASGSDSAALSNEQPVTRRGALRAAACGFGFLGLADLLTRPRRAPADPLAPRKPHFAPKAKRVIFLFMHGGVVAHRHLRSQGAAGSR